MSNGEPSLEFKRPEDDAWYPVTLECDGEALIVKFRSPDIPDPAIFQSRSFRNLGEVLDFQLLFRRESTPLRDSDCRNLESGMDICARYQFYDGSFKFFDAVLHAVWSAEHLNDNGNERCICEFLISWTNGPRAGKVTVVEKEDVRLITEDAALNPTLDSFLDTVYSTGLQDEGDDDAPAGEHDSDDDAPAGEHDSDNDAPEGEHVSDDEATESEHNSDDDAPEDEHDSDSPNEALSGGSPSDRG